MRTAKAQIGLRGCAVRSWPSLSANRSSWHYRMYQWRANARTWLRMRGLNLNLCISCAFEDVFSLDVAQMMLGSVVPEGQKTIYALMSKKCQQGVIFRDPRLETKTKRTDGRKGIRTGNVKTVNLTPPPPPHTHTHTHTHTQEGYKVQ